MSIMRARRLALIWLATLILPLWIFLPTARNALCAMRNGIIVQGTLSRLRPDDHRSIVVDYQVGGTIFRSSTSLPESLGLPSFDELRIGDKIPISYIQDRPDNGIRVIRGNYLSKPGRTSRWWHWASLSSQSRSTAIFAGGNNKTRWQAIATLSRKSDVGFPRS